MNKNQPKKTKHVELLNTRQWWLYYKLKEIAEADPKKWCEKKELCEMSQKDEKLYKRWKYEWKDTKTTKSHDECSIMWSDLRMLQNYPGIRMVIVDKTTGKFKIATSYEESKCFIDGFLDKALRQLKTYWAMKEKADFDGQGKLKLSKQAKAKAIYEAYINQLEDDNEENYYL